MLLDFDKSIEIEPVVNSGREANQSHQALNLVSPVQHQGDVILTSTATINSDSG